MSAIQIDGEHLDFAQLYRVVFEGATVELAALARGRMLASRAVIERLIASNQAVYGVNTGFGKMASVRISREQIGELQVNLVRSQQRQLPRFGLSPARGPNRHILEGDAVEAGERFHLSMIRDDHGNFAIELAGAPAVEQVGHAVQHLRTKQRHARPARARRQLPAHVELGGHRHKSSLESFQIEGDLRRRAGPGIRSLRTLFLSAAVILPAPIAMSSMIFRSQCPWKRCFSALTGWGRWERPL